MQQHKQQVLVYQLPSLPSPSLLPSYEEEWEKNTSNSGTALSISGLAWHNQYLVAVTSSGDVCIWDVPVESDSYDYDELMYAEILKSRQEPVLK